MQISYHSALTKIQKLQNLEKRNFFLYRPVRPVLPEIGRYSQCLNQYETLMFRYRYGTYRPVRPVPVWYWLPWSKGKAITCFKETTNSFEMLICSHELL